MSEERLWPWLAAIAGAITALSFEQYRHLSWGERFMLTFVGITFAIFVGPLIVGYLFDGEAADSKIVGGAYYVIAMSANAIIPIVLRAAKAFANKFRIGGEE